MTTYRRWAIPLVVAGCAAVGTALAFSRQTKGRHVAKQQHKENLQSWEGEGGSLHTPAAAQPLPSASPDPAIAIRS